MSSHNQRVFWGTTAIGDYVFPGISVNTYRKFIVPRSHGWRMVLRAVECPHRARRAVDRSEAFYHSHRGLLCADLCFGYTHTHSGSYLPIFTYERSRRVGQLCTALPIEVAKRIRKWARTRRVMVRETLCDLPHMPVEMIRIIAAFAY